LPEMSENATSRKEFSTCGMNAASMKSVNFWVASSIAPPVRGAGDGPVLVLTPPWGDALQVVADAGGRPVGPGQSWLGLLATPETADLTADFPAALRASGAWAVLNGRVVAALCGWTG
ncbi:MAG: hypothetical protein VXW43_18510, partial [Pseudomonadota bacterium]|nr:hypothetical protein [Pseudomonadota bacterium]